MRIKIGDTWYDANDQPIMVELNHEERQQIYHMHDDSKGRYCQYPDQGYEVEQIQRWMNE